MACAQLGLPVRAIHVNHHLQAAAGSMQAHCEAFCMAQGIALDILHARIDRQGGQSLEASAREQRYSLIGQHMRLCGDGRLLLTAHHQDDQIETTLIALFRGSGIEGLAGMQSLADWPDVESGAGRLFVGRPLLGLRRAVIVQEVADFGWAYVEDPSNADRSFRRNALRLAVLPEIRGHFAQVDASLLRLNRQVSALREEWRSQAAALVDACSDESGLLLQQAVLALPDAQQQRLLRHWLAKSGIRINEAKTLELLAQLRRPHGGQRQVALGWCVRIRQGRMSIQVEQNNSAMGCADD
jgi:tRNA(Ile)-lysidine synthase